MNNCSDKHVRGAWGFLGAAINFGKSLTATTCLHIREVSWERGRLARRFSTRSRLSSSTNGDSGDGPRFERHNFWLHPGALGPVFLALALWVLVPAGCAGPALNPDMHNTFLDSHDLVVMTDKMAASIASDPILASLTARGPITIVLTPLKNETDQLIPRDQGDIFLHRLRALLTAEPMLRRQFIFVLNRATYQRLEKRERLGVAQLGPKVRRLQPGYALQATFYSDNKVSPEYRSAYYLCTFFLTNIHTGQIIWEGSYETKKAVHSGFLD